MATGNPFDLLGDDDNDDPSHLIAVQQKKIAAKIPAAEPPTVAAKLPSKPVPPAQAVREAKGNAPMTRGSFGRGGRGRGGRGDGFVPNRDFGDGNANGFTGGYGRRYESGPRERAGDDAEDGGSPLDRERARGSYGPPRFRGGRGGYSNGEDGGDSEHPPRRVYERRSGTGRGSELKREGSGRGNWGTPNDDVIVQAIEENLNSDEKVVAPVAQPEQEGKSPDANAENKEAPTNEPEEKKPEDKEMTLEEYEKVREEKRKALLALKAEERKVEVDKEFESMQQLSVKKGNDDVFIKLGSDKRKENAEREERTKKSVSINEFLKPAEGERYYSPSSRGHGRGRGDRAPFRGGFGGGRSMSAVPAPSIEDPSHFPTLVGGK